MKRTVCWLLGIMGVMFTTIGQAQESLVAKARDMDVQVVDRNCWVDIFEDTEFDADDPHVRLQGPFESATLKDIAGQDWNDEIQSLHVGPNAMVFAYEDRDFSGTEVAFVANQRVSELDELDMSDDIESIKIQCRNE